MNIPIDVTFHPKWWHKNVGINFNKDFFYNVDYRLESDIKMRKTLYEKFGDLGLGEKDPSLRPILGSDLIASGFLYSEILGCEVRYSDENPPEVICNNLGIDNVDKLEVPTLENSPVWQQVEENINLLQKKFGYVDSCINLQGIQNIALDIMGANLFIEYYSNPQIVEHLLNICTQLSINIGKRLKEVSQNISSGVTSIIKQTKPNVYLTSNCSVEMVSKDIYDEFLFKYDNILAEQFKSFGIHHCGGTLEHVVEGYAKVKNLKFVEVGAGSDIKYVRKILPDIHLNLRYSPVKLKDITNEQLQKDIGSMIQNGKPYNLISISCVGIDDSVSDEQIRIFLKTCKQFKYGEDN